MSKRDKRLSVKDVILIIVCSFILSFIFSIFFKIATVDGISMDNTLYSSERVILYTKAYVNKEPSRGDIVIAQTNNYELRYLVKRVIGLPGEKLEIRNNIIYIDGKEYKEDYLKEPMVTADLCIDVPEGEVFVMGDNRNVSSDSRNLIAVGTFDYKKEILGRVVYNISDFSKIK